MDTIVEFFNNTDVVKELAIAMLVVLFLLYIQYLRWRGEDRDNDDYRDFENLIAEIQSNGCLLLTEHPELTRAKVYEEYIESVRPEYVTNPYFAAFYRLDGWYLLEREGGHYTLDYIHEIVHR